MSPLQIQIRRARFQLTLNRWLVQVCISVTVAAGVFGIVVLLARLFGWDWPMGWIALGVFGVGVAASIVWAMATRVGFEVAATALDEAAGLRERISSGLYCRSDSHDPFERAVVSEAERVSSNITVKQHLRLAYPKQFAGAAVMTVVAFGMLLLPSGILSPAEAMPEESVEQFERTVNNITKRIRQIKPIAKSNAEMAKLAEEIDKLGTAPNAKLQNTRDVRHEALKKLDRMQDALKDRKASDKFKSADEFKKMLRGLAPMKRQDALASKLSEAMRKGDFKAAADELKKMRDKLSETAKSPEAKQQLEVVKKQLDDLAKQLEKLAKNDKLMKKLKQAGLNKEQIEKLMKQMSKEDVENLKKKLQEQGMSQKAIEKIAKEMQKQKGARDMAQKMSLAMQAASSAMQAGKMGDAQQQMDSAAAQMSAMEAMEQELSDMNSALAALQDAKNDIGNPCSKCNGSGECQGKKCGSCSGSGCKSGKGPGMGKKPGQGRGGIAQEDASRTQFVRKQGKVKMGQGAIAGQYLVDGPQEKGEVSDAVYEMVQAGERDATDMIENAKAPRKYHRAIKDYFSELQADIEKMDGGKGGKGSKGGKKSSSKRSGSDDSDSGESDSRDE